MRYYILSSALLISLSLNVFVGYRYLSKEVYQAGLNAGAQSGYSQVSQYIESEIKSKGQLSISRVNDKGQPEITILVPKK